MFTIGFNTEREPFDDVRVRRAISMAINNEDVVNNLYNGYGTPAKGPIAPGVIGYDDSIEPIEYNPEEAKKLLEEAGIEEGYENHNLYKRYNGASRLSYICSS